MNKGFIKIKLLGVAIFLLGFSCCNKIDLFEKVISIPQQEWKSGFKPAFKFTIIRNKKPRSCEANM